MPQANAAHTINAGHSASISLQGFIVSVADGPAGEYRPVLDRAGEPHIFDTGEAAINASLAWGRATGKTVRIDPLNPTPTADEIDELIADLDAAAARPTLDSYETWLIQEREREAAADLARYRRIRRAAARCVYGHILDEDGAGAEAPVFLQVAE
jgi:hypothetical protein